MKRFDKTKMIYCYNVECEYCDSLTGWCILSNSFEWETICSDKMKALLKNFGNDLERIEYEGKQKG